MMHSFNVYSYTFRSEFIVVPHPVNSSAQWRSWVRVSAEGSVMKIYILTYLLTYSKIESISYIQQFRLLLIRWLSWKTI